MPQPMLDIRIQSKHFGDKQVLGGIHFGLQAGEIVSLVGASGCGKSTLLRSIAGLDRQYAGSVFLEGERLEGRSPEIGFVFQESRLFPWLNVADNVAFGADPRHPDPARASRLLAEVGLAGYEKTLPKQLSGGQTQRVAIARGLFTQPRVLLLDEPFSAVDAFTRMKLQELLTRIALDHGVTVLMVTHDIDEAAFLSDRMLVLDAKPGTLREDVPVTLARPRNRADDSLSAARLQVLAALQRVHAI
jgi:sulfonate transport system ATP-binding protein